MADAMDERDPDRRPDELHDDLVPVVGPNPGLLVVLVAVFVAAAVAIVFTRGPDPSQQVMLGSLERVAQDAQAGPLYLAELPHLVVMRTWTPEPIYDASWGRSTGSLLLTPFEQLVVLELVDPADGEPLVWCEDRNVFEHPDGRRLYGPDGALLQGDGRRGMDRRALGVIAAGAVRVDDGRWVSGIPRRTTDTSFAPRGPSCLQDAG
ncbi:MAG: hypothetical protein ACI9AD_000655 [Nitriliruptoraceae bacterium]|jgi:hypothetical protein